MYITSIFDIDSTCVKNHENSSIKEQDKPKRQFIGDLRTKQTTPPRIRLQATIDSTNIKQKDNHRG
jgi:hypothetical protein